MSRQALGRGLSALLGDQESVTGSESDFVELDLDLLSPNSEQPRENFSKNELEELAQSIKTNGVVQPIVVRRAGKGFQIVAGERRWRAAQLAGVPRIPAVIRDVSDDKMLEVALIENIQREELNPVEEARAYRKLIDSVGLTQESLAKRVGKTRPFVANYLRLLNLPPNILKMLETGQLSVGHARALLALDDPEMMTELARRVISKSFSVRETEIAVKRILRGSSQTKKRKSSPRKKDPNVARAETKLRRKYATNVKIVEGSTDGPGRIEFEYYGEADLDRLYRLLLDK